ncbi:MAG: PTS sugar transporter [Caldibacillus debilis]|nr:MAG: PTS sugar transporter [Caldibacillus debilis]
MHLDAGLKERQKRIKRNLSFDRDERKSKKIFYRQHQRRHIAVDEEVTFLIEKELIFLDDELTSRDEIVRKMSENVRKLGMITDVNAYMEAVLKREEKIPTTVGLNVSIPHGKSEAVQHPFVTFMRTKNPIVWDERSDEKVKLIFMIGVPIEQKDKLHIKILAQISKNLIDETFRNRLLEASSTEEVYRLLKQIEDHIYAEGKENGE